MRPPRKKLAKNGVKKKDHIQTKTAQRMADKCNEEPYICHVEVCPFPQKNCKNVHAEHWLRILMDREDLPFIDEATLYDEW